MSGVAPTREKVLAVDDDEAFLRFEAEVLEDHGVDVCTATSAEEALGILRGEPDVSLVLLDVALDGSSGLSLCRDIKSDRSLSSIPVMFVTGEVEAEEVTELVEAGADEFSLKPFRVQEFVIRVKALLRLGRKGRDLADRAVSAERLASRRTTELDEMRRFAEGVVASLASGVVVVDSDLSVLFVNESFRRIFDREGVECTGSDLAEIAGDEFLSRAGLRELAAKALESGERLGATGVHLGRAGGEDSVVDVRVRAVAYGGTTHTLMVFDDVTDRWHAQETIRVEAERLQDVVDAVGAGLSRVNQRGEFLWTNNTFREWFGDPGERRLMEVFGSTEGQEAKLILGECFETQCFGKVRMTRMGPDGSKRHFESTFAPIRDERGRVFEVLVLTLDITEVASRVEQLTLLRRLGWVIQGARDLDRVLSLILTCVTAGHALEFNRAFLFLVDDEAGTLEGRTGVGPATREEAYRVWSELSDSGYTLGDVIEQYGSSDAPPATGKLTDLARSKSYPLDAEDEILVRTVLEREPVLVTDAAADPRVSAEFRAAFEAKEFAVVPMLAKDEIIGVILADNIYSGRPVTDSHVELLMMFAQQAAMVIDSVAAYQELQEKIATIREQAEQIVRSEKLATIGRMAAHVAHEIRNPLVTIGGFARAIYRHPERVERSRSNAWIIAEEVTRLEEMLAGVMDFTKPAKPTLIPLIMNYVVATTLDSCEEMLSERRVSIETELDPEPPQVVADEKQMHQVLLNLVNNAVESMPEGGSLVVTSEHEEDWVRVKIRDTGLGIPDEIIPRLFSPFFTTKTEGTGLGLAVTQKIVEDHGGRIEVASAVGTGTVFTVWLPVDKSVVPGPNAGGRAEQ